MLNNDTFTLSWLSRDLIKINTRDNTCNKSIIVGMFIKSYVNCNSCVAMVTKTDRPKSVRNRCVIEVFGDVFMLSR